MAPSSYTDVVALQVNTIYAYVSVRAGAPLNCPDGLPLRR
jgi:hypothetical protein